MFPIDCSGLIGRQYIRSRESYQCNIEQVCCFYSTVISRGATEAAAHSDRAEMRWLQGFWRGWIPEPLAWASDSSDRPGRPKDRSDRMTPRFCEVWPGESDTRRIRLVFAD
jgi:hypothetical protein